MFLFIYIIILLVNVFVGTFFLKQIHTTISKKIKLVVGSSWIQNVGKHNYHCEWTHWPNKTEQLCLREFVVAMLIGPYTVKSAVHMKMFLIWFVFSTLQKCFRRSCHIWIPFLHLENDCLLRAGEWTRNPGGWIWVRTVISLFWGVMLHNL